MERTSFMCRHLHRPEDPDRHKTLLSVDLNKLHVTGEANLSLSALSLLKTCALIACCVVCCLAFSELPETLNLTDDSSNDFIVVNELCTTENSESVEISAVTHQKTRPSPQPANPFDIDCSFEQPQYASNLLSLLSLRRI